MKSKHAIFNIFKNDNIGVSRFEWTYRLTIEIKFSST
jgi:hypothetical protein